MTIATYSDLQAAIGNWLDHSLFASRTPEFIALFEASANRRLRVREQEGSTTLTPSAGAATLPADYLMWRRVTWTGSTRVELQYVHPSYLQAAYPSSPSDVPRIFTIEGRKSEGTGKPEAKDSKREDVDVPKDNKPYEFPVAVLINGKSASASEIVAGAIKDSGAGVIIGEHTFGKGLVQTLFPLNDGSALRLTTAKYFTPKLVDISNETPGADIRRHQIVGASR